MPGRCASVSLLTMRFLPDPILRQQAKKIATIPRNFKQYTDDMVETMHDQQGVGLAANQVGSLQKVAVIQLPEWEEALILINPEIIRREGEREVEEGCLSIPGYRGTVRRSERVRARAMDLSGKLVRIKADGLLAQALEHETDHLNGKLYIDHLVSRDAIWKISYNPEEEESSEESPEDSSEESTGQ
ncbi:MAG: peptide deformylase [Dehalococcoidia bacterium]